MIAKNYLDIRMARRVNRWFSAKRTTKRIMEGFPERAPRRVTSNMFNYYLDVVMARRWLRYQHSTGGEDMASFAKR